MLCTHLRSLLCLSEPKGALSLPSPAPHFHLPEIGQQKYFRDSRGWPRQDGGPLGAQLLGRGLGAPVGPQRVLGGHGEAAARARGGQEGAGPAAGSGSRGLRRAGRCTAPGCRPLMSYPWPATPPRRGGRLPAPPPGSRVIILALAKLSGRWGESPKRARAASLPSPPRPPPPGKNQVPESRVAARAPGARDGGRAFGTRCEVKQLCRCALRAQSKRFYCKLCFRLTPNFLAHP